MALDAHLQSLNRQHRELDAALAQELKQSCVDEFKAHELKRRKLRLKDQIAAINRQSRPEE